jgi:hypothetical protein
MLWLINQATAGELTQPGSEVHPTTVADITGRHQALGTTSPNMDFTNIKIDVTAG